MLGSVSAGKRAALHRGLGLTFVVLASIPLSHGLSVLGFPVPDVRLPYYQPLA